MPENILDIIIKRIESLSRDAQKILSYASIRGKQVRFEMLVELSGKRFEEVLKAVEELLEKIMDYALEVIEEVEREGEALIGRERKREREDRGRVKRIRDKPGVMYTFEGERRVVRDDISGQQFDRGDVWRGREGVDGVVWNAGISIN